MEAVDLAPLEAASAAAAIVPLPRSAAGNRSAQEPARSAPMKSLRESDT